ncbi:helix-turn-helix domain-containing protein [Streptomyces griseoluteus]|uniref:helix-turn-helix domain-containing protein n=1 Tax=Streptomyces griseoluteus TaxID=29306 RepID=UPI00331A7FE9
MAVRTTPLISADWIKLRDAAAQLGCDRKTISNRIAAGKIPGVRVVKMERVVRLHREDWEAYLQRSLVPEKAV